jgi:hypothetical protein
VVTLSCEFGGKLLKRVRVRVHVLRRLPVEQEGRATVIAIVTVTATGRRMKMIGREDLTVAARAKVRLTRIWPPLLNGIK